MSATANAPTSPTSPLPKRPKISHPNAMPASTSAAAPVADPGSVNIESHIHPSPPIVDPGTVNTDSHVPLAPSTAASPALQVKLLTPAARAPTRGSALAAGYDVYASASATVPARGRALVSTGIAVAVPAGTYGRVAPRSGLAVKHGIATGAGVIDADYRGEVKVLLFNTGEADFAVGEGDRVAQLVLERIVTPDVAVVRELVDTVRGAGGFGSTGGFGGAAGVVE